MKTKKRAWTLSPEQQAMSTDALKNFFRICDEVDDLDVLEYQALQADAKYGRQMRQPPSEVTDARLAESRESVVREFHGNRRMTKGDIYNRVARLVGLAPSTVRDRFLKMPSK